MKKLFLALLFGSVAGTFLLAQPRPGAVPGPISVAGGGISSNTVYNMILTYSGGSTSGITAAQATNIVNNNYAASAGFATNGPNGQLLAVTNKPYIHGALVVKEPEAVYGVGSPVIGIGTNYGPAIDSTGGQMRYLGGAGFGHMFMSQNPSTVNDNWAEIQGDSLSGRGVIYSGSFTPYGNYYGVSGNGTALMMPYFKDGNPISALSPLPMKAYTTWWEYHTNATAAIITNIANYMVSSGLRDAGFTYINLDDGWQAAARSAGHLTWNTTKFPSGIKPVADYLHSLGLKLGIYTAFSTNTCEGLPGSPSVYLEQDIYDFASWKVDAVKLDDCTGQEPADFYNARGAAILAKAIMNVSRASGYGATNHQPIVSIMSMRRLETTNPFDSRPNDWNALGSVNIWEDATPFHFRPGGADPLNWCSPSNSWALGRSALNSKRFVGPGNYEEVMGFSSGGTNLGGAGNLITNNSLRIGVTACALMSSPLIIGAFGSSNMWAFTNREVLRIVDDSQFVPSLMTVSNSFGDRWIKTLSEGFGTNGLPAGASGEKAIGLFNISATNKSFTVSAADLGIPTNTIFDVRDCWYQTNVTRAYGGSFSFTVTPTNAALLLISVPKTAVLADEVGVTNNLTFYRNDGVIMGGMAPIFSSFFGFWGTPTAGSMNGNNYNMLFASAVTRLNVQSGGVINGYINNGTRLFEFNGTTAVIDQVLTADGNNVTNVQAVNIVSRTNGFSGALANFAVAEATTNMSGGLTFTGISNFNSTNYNSTIVHAFANGANRTVLVPAEWRQSRPDMVVTNGHMSDFFIECQIGLFTNITQLDFF